MLEKLGYEQYRGVLESANGITSGGTAYGDNGITISGIAYENKFGDVSKYFGLEIEFLVKKDTNEVYYVRARGNYNSLTVEAEDINANTSLTEFCYDVNGKEKKQDLENITIIYNGKPLVSADVNADALKPDDGRVILIDSDGNDKYETELVWEYRNIMVNNVYDDVVYGRYSESADLSAEKSSKSVSLTYNSETVTVDEIKQGDILSVFESKDGSYIRAIISRDTYNGVIKTERKGKSVTLSDGKELKYSKTYNDLISGTSPTLTPPSFGDQVTFYTDAYGKIAFYVRDAQSRERSYGYLTNVLCDNWSYQDACVENFLLAECDELPEGMLPQCYPADHPRGDYIPQWGMWFFVQLEQYKERNKCIKISDYKDFAYGFLGYFKTYENEFGLLENLGGWNFVEWSKANEWTDGVNFPTNMLYAKVMETVGKWYGDGKLIEKAAQLRRTVTEMSYDGEFFRDQAVRRDGKLVCAEHISEVCQYYAFMFETVTAETFPDLYKTMVNDFLPDGGK